MEFLKEFIYDNLAYRKMIKFDFFGSEKLIEVILRAFEPEDGVEPEQEKNYIDFISKQKHYTDLIEKKLLEYSDEAEQRFTLNCLLIQRDGDLALLLDDENDLDDGIAIQILPSMKIMSQDDYL